MDELASVGRRYAALDGVLDERSRRLVAAAECKAWGTGGISAISQATGVSRQVIRQGLRELDQPPTRPEGRIRRPGGGRKKARQKDPTLVADLQQLLESTTRGHPETCLRWTCKSVRKLAEELQGMGHQVSYPVVAELLHELDYSLQVNRKTKEGDGHPDRNAQFEYINAKALLRNNSSTARRNFVVPFAVEVIASETNLRDLFVGYFDPFRVDAVINLGMDL